MQLSSSKQIKEGHSESESIRQCSSNSTVTGAHWAPTSTMKQKLPVLPVWAREWEVQIAKTELPYIQQRFRGDVCTKNLLF